MTLCSTLVSALSLGQKPLLMQGEEELPTLNHSQMLNHVSFYNSMNETWLHILEQCLLKSMCMEKSCNHLFHPQLT